MAFKQLAFLMLILLCFWSCEKLLPPAPDDADVMAAPLDDLSPEQLERHIAGDEDFAKVFSVEEGLGPIFVHSSCEGCHVGDGKGHPFSTLTRFGKYDALNNKWDPLRELGGPQLQHRAISGFTAEKIPEEATGITRIMPPAVSGLGFVEFLADDSILTRADPLDLDGDGISGVPNYVFPRPYFDFQPFHVTDGNGRFIGRFGKKAGAIDLLQQIAGAYVNDMGISSDFESEDLTNVQLGNHVGDNVPEPEVHSAAVRNVVFYVKTLKAPPRRNEDRQDVLKGESLFYQIGCEKCHRANFTTTHSEIEALNQKTFHPYSDFLLHDMGPELDDGYIEGLSTTAEWRTAPLWGLGLAEDSQGGQLFLLHDGRAKSYEEAILLHGGEGDASRQNFNQLSEQEKSDLMSFLKSL